MLGSNIAQIFLCFQPTLQVQVGLFGRPLLRLLFPRTFAAFSLLLLSRMRNAAARYLPHTLLSHLGHGPADGLLEATDGL
jgi:hypothetical protein